jgi:hypothetical protein
MVAGQSAARRVAAMNVSLQAPNVAAVWRSPAVVFRRVWFISEVPAGGKVVRRFSEPRRCVAVEETLDLSAVSTDNGIPESTEDLIVALLPGDAADEAARLKKRWMDDRDTAPAAFAMSGAQRIAWRPGRAIVQGSAAGLERSLDVLTVFAFYEGELRHLERVLDDSEERAQNDIARAHMIRLRDRGHWRRLGALSEHFCRLRLRYVLLAPRLAASHRMHPESRQIMIRLLEQADIPDRLQAVSARLEAYEDLYQGAVDRIMEYRWYFGGHWLEISIIVLLLFECCLMATDLCLVHLK